METAARQSWEQTTTLSETQLECLNRLESLVSERPLPREFQGPQVAQNAPAKSTSGSEDEFELLQSLCGIDSVQQFYAWFSEMEEKVEAEKEEKYRLYMDTLKQYAACCDELLSEIVSAMNALGELDVDYSLVSTKTSALHDACESLVKEKNRLAAFADSIGAKLRYFDEVDNISRQLNNPTLTVMSDNFLPLLVRLDQCLQYVADNPQYKDADTYSVRFTQLQQRALTLIRNHVIGTLKTTTHAVATFIKDTSAGGVLSGEAEERLVYVRYQCIAPTVKGFTQELAKRSQRKEFGVLLADCCSCYCQQRMSILSTIIRAHYDIMSKNQDLPGLTRAGCVYLARLCHQEYQLFTHFFPSSPQLDEGVKGLIESVSQILYDNLRPLFVRQVDIECLCQIIEVLKAEVLEDSRRMESMRAFQPVASRMLHDVQERLIYRAQMYIRDDIRSYPPTSHDLNYPNKLLEVVKLEGAARAAEAEAAALSQSSGGTTHDGALTAQAMHTIYSSWFPTLERTLMLLSKLYRSLETQVFEGIAHEAVSVCTESFLSAAKTIHKSKGVVDSQLFLIKHLLILREQITPFDIDFSLTEKTLDFSHLKDALGKVVRAGPQALVSFVYQATPKVLDVNLDSKKDLENELKHACEQFILHVTNMAIQPLLSYLTKVSAFQSVRTARETANTAASSLSAAASIREQPFAHPERAHEIVQVVMEALDSEVKPVVAKMWLYLSSPATTNILFKPIKNNILDAFSQLAKVIETEYLPADALLIDSPSPQSLSQKLDALLSSSSPLATQDPGASSPPPADQIPLPGS